MFSHIGTQCFTMLVLNCLDHFASFTAKEEKYSKKLQTEIKTQLSVSVLATMDDAATVLPVER